MNSNISIYIPAYNAEKTIEKSLNSILNQSIKPDKILIINDHSTDATLEILNKYKDKISIINNPKNMGVSYSMNVANKYLTSRYVAKIDADVELENHWIEKLLTKIKGKNFVMIGGKMYEKYIDNPFNFWRSQRLKQNWGENDIINPNFIFGCNNILDTTKIDIIKKYIIDNNYFKTNGEDIEICNFFKKNNLNTFYDSQTVCYHLQDDDGKSLSNRYWRYLYYGDGLKKRNFFKTIKNIIRQIKKTLKWTIEDIIKLNFKLVIVNFIILFYFINIDFKFYLQNRND